MEKVGNCLLCWGQENVLVTCGGRHGKLLEGEGKGKCPPLLSHQVCLILITQFCHMYCYGPSEECNHALGLLGCPMSPTCAPQGTPKQDGKVCVVLEDKPCAGIGGRSNDEEPVRSMVDHFGFFGPTSFPFQGHYLPSHVLSFVVIFHSPF